MGDLRKNREESIATLTAANAAGNSVDLYNPHGDALKLWIDVTAISGTGATLTVTVKGKDPASGKYTTILASAGLTAVATTVLTIFPGATASANVSANDFVPHTFRVEWTITGTSPSVTATIGAAIRAAGGVA